MHNKSRILVTERGLWGTASTKYFSVSGVSLGVGAGALRKTKPVFVHSQDCYQAVFRTQQESETPFYVVEATNV